jgi:hypothetical protein
MSRLFTVFQIGNVQIGLQNPAVLVAVAATSSSPVVSCLAAAELCC